MKRKHFKHYIILLSCAMFAFQSCNDLDLGPTNKFTEDTYWNSPDKAAMVLNRAYNQMLSSAYYFKTDALSDNLYEGRQSYDTKIVSSGQANSANGRFSGEWANCYRCIKTCHIFLENVDRVPNMDENLRTRMKAEARFLRAYQFFRLATWFGDVPFFTQDISLSESKTVSQTSRAEVLKFVHNELAEVAEILPTKQEYADSDNGRITAGAAIAMKARVYLYDNDWGNVAATCEKLINTTAYGKYTLFPSYAGLFHPDNENNEEVILDIQYVPIQRTWNDLRDWIPLSAGGRVNDVAPTQELVDSYLTLDGLPVEEDPVYDEENPYINRDPRLSASIAHHGCTWTDPDGTERIIYTRPGSAPDANAAVDEYGPGKPNASSTGYYAKKYFDPTYTGNEINSGLNLIMLRYADVLLMYAEAKNELGQMTETVWNQTIRPIRERAGFTVPYALNYNASGGQTKLREIIRRERRCELAFEDTRTCDIRRWKISEIVLNGYPHGAKFSDPTIDKGYIRGDLRMFNPERDYWFAIPQSQIDLNPNLKQNPNY